MTQFPLLSFVGLSLVALLLFFAWQKKWIQNETLNALSAIGSIVAGLAALLLFLPLVRFGDDSEGTPTPVNTVVPTSTITPTAAPTETPTPTPEPTPPIVYDWTNQDDYSLISGWDVISDSLGVTYYEQGEYVVRTKRRSVLYVGRWKDIGQNFENGTIQVRVQRLASPGASDTAGIVFGWRNDLEGNSYALTIDKQGSCYFWEEVGEGWKLRNYGATERFFPDLESHKLTVAIRNNRAFGYVDDEFCTDQALVAYDQGYIGVAAHSFLEQIEGGTAYFDDFMVAVE